MSDGTVEPSTAGLSTEQQGGKILFLSQCLPYPPHSGVTKRTFNVLKQLSRSFDTTLIAFSRKNHQPDATSRRTAEDHLSRERVRVFTAVPIPNERSPLRLLWDHGRSIVTGRPYTFYEYSSRRFERALASILTERPPELVHVDSLDLYRWLDGLPPVPIVCTHHNVESHLLRRRAGGARNRLLQWYMAHQADHLEKVEREMLPGFAANLVMSEVDGSRLRELAPGARTAVVPNGVDTDFFRADDRSPEHARVVFLGPTYMFPNLDGVDYFLADIWPLVHGKEKSASLDLIGSTPEQHRNRFDSVSGVRCLGYVDDIRPHFRTAACSIVPLRIGGGTRLKILDAWAMGVPVVSTSVGCEGLETHDGHNILIRDDASSFAEAVLRVLQDREFASELGRNGRATAETVYSWEVIGRSMRELYTSLLAETAAHE